MHVPTAEELAAIATAYMVLTAESESPASPRASRWSLAGRLPDVDEQRVRFATTPASRWNAAGRLNG